MKKSISVVISVGIIAVLLVVLGSLVYVIYDQISDFSVTVTEVATEESGTVESVTTETEETTAATEEILLDKGREVYVYGFDGKTAEYHRYNEYGGIVLSKYYENDMLVLTREHHITPAGYRDGYTETYADGRAVRYNQDGSVRE